MKYILDEEKKQAVPTLIVKPAALKALTHPIRSRILRILAKKPNYPLNMARELSLNEQTVYYHIRQLEKAGLVEKSRAEHLGVPEFYSVKKTAFSIIPDYIEYEPTNLNFYEYSQIPRIFEGFVENGKIDCKIVVGSPLPKEDSKKSMKSGYLAGEIAAILGRYGKSEERICFIDSDIESKKQNFIIIGGHHVNSLEDDINESLPIRFNEAGTKIISTISKEEYRQPEMGFICRAANPFDKSKSVLVIAGIESVGTKAAIYGMVRYFDRIEKGNMYDKKAIAKVVEGIDQDGRITDVKFLE